MLNDIITTPMRITRTQNKCNTIMTQLSKFIIDKIKAGNNIEEEKEEAER